MRTLVDTSAWRRFIRDDLDVVRMLIRRRQAVLHPWVLGELSLGSPLPSALYHEMSFLPTARIVTCRAQVTFIQDHRLHSRGMGWVDTQILASAHKEGYQLLTFDEALADAARRVLSLTMRVYDPPQPTPDDHDRPG